MNYWYIYTDGQHHYSLAQAPGGNFIMVHAGPFNTWAEGAAQMKALGVPGW